MSDDVLRTLEAKLRELDAVNEIGRSLTASLDLREVLATIMTRMGDLLKPRSSSLLLVEERTGELVFEVASGEGTLSGFAVETDDATGLAIRVAPVRLGPVIEESRPLFWE